MHQQPHRALWGSAVLAVCLASAGWAQPTQSPALFDSMPEIAQELREAVMTANDAPTLIEAAHRLRQAPSMSSLIPLPTPGVGEERLGFDRAIGQIRQTLDVFREAAMRKDIPGEARAVMLRAKTDLEAELDTILTLAAQTAEIEPDTPEAEAFLNQGLEEMPKRPPRRADAPRRETGRAPEALRLLRPRRSRQVRAPWPPIPLPVLSAPQEDIRVATIGINECMVVLKEIQGLKRRVRWILIPVWVEPWAARARIIDFRKIWIYEWVPAEFLKKIITCNDCCNNITQEIHTEIVEEPELLDFWFFYPKDP